MATAPILHQKLSLKDRCECGLTGFLALDVFRCLAEERCSSYDMPKGSMFMAPQTSYNLMGSALIATCICICKDPNFHPWKVGTARLSEMAVEEWFSMLRRQSSNAQLSARSFFQAAARMQQKNGKTLNNLRATQPKPEPPLTEQEPLSRLF